MVLSLTAVQTRTLINHPSVAGGKFAGGKFVGVWDLQWTAAASQPRTLCQGKVECEYDVTR